MNIFNHDESKRSDIKRMTKYDIPDGTEFNVIKLKFFNLSFPPLERLTCRK